MSLKVMKGVYLIGHGGFEKLQYKQDILKPALLSNEVLIKTHAAGINNTDINTRIAWYAKNNKEGNNINLGINGIESLKNSDGSWSGSSIKFPRIQGIDSCGEIVEVGSEVDKNRLGERVLVNPCMKINSKYVFFGSEIDGAFAEFTKVQDQFAIKINSNLTSEELSSFPCSYSTAENMLTKTKLSKGETILISASSGGVGSAAIPLAKRRGAYVIAMSSPKKIHDIKKLGTDKIVERDKLFTLDNQSIDVVIDLVGGHYSNIMIDKLKRFGRYASAGAVSRPFADIDIRTIYLKDLSLFGCTVLEKNVFKNLVKYIENNEIKPLVAKIFNLRDLVDAQKFFLEKKYIGKIVLTTY